MNPIPFFDVQAQYRRLQSTIDARLRTVLDHGRFILGPEVQELESRLAAFCGTRHCIGVSDGTTALQIALMALGIGPGDEVITTPFTFVATAETILLVGATPVFVDVDPRSANVDPAAMEAAITPRTRALLPVDLYGQCANADAIGAIALRHGLPVIEDAAQSLGATWGGRRAGSLGTIGCTSFFPSKPLGCFGDGGACFTDDDALASTMASIRAHGQSVRYTHVRLGLNGRLDTLQAAVLLAKLDAFEEDIAARDRAARRYDELITQAGLAPDCVRLPWIDPRATSVHAQYTLRVADRDRVASRMGEAGIPTAVHYPICLHHQPLLRERFSGLSLPHAEQLSREVLSLPMHPDLDEGIQQRIVAALVRAVTTPGSTATTGSTA